MIFIACSVPDEGERIIDILSGPLSLPAKLMSRRNRPTKAPWAFVKGKFTNDTSPEDAVEVPAGGRPRAPPPVLRAAARRW
jgi:hypothetical protein